MKKILPLVLLLPLVVLGCMSADTTFFIQKTDDESKARFITQEGIDQYNLYLVQRQEFDKIPQIKEYFNVALRFDPANTQAQQYLDLIDNFKAQKMQANVDNATKLLAKAKRTDDDTYALAVSLQTAARIDPADQTVQKMLKDTAADQAKLADSYMAKSTAALAGIDDKSTDATKEKQYVESFQNASKALTLDPQNAAAQTQVKSTQVVLATLVTKRVTTIQQLVTVGKYTDARTQLTALSDLNKRSSNGFDDEVKSASYSLNFSWAKALFAQKDYPNADTRVDAALAVNRTAEATTLKKQITAARAKADTGVNFDTALKDIDRLIAAGDLVSAHNKITATAKTTTDQTKRSQLDVRHQSIIDKLKDIYAEGVQAYKDEDFNKAVDDLQIIVSIQVDYEQASDYLDKAKSKQKLLNQF
jgi:hypothetical protein